MWTTGSGLCLFQCSLYTHVHLALNSDTQILFFIQSGILEPLRVISARLNGRMKNGEDKDCEELFEQVQTLAAGTVGQI